MLLATGVVPWDWQATADERDPVAVFLGDVAHHLADESGAEPVLCGEGLVEAGALVGQDRADRERTRRHLPSCSRGRRGAVSTVASAQVRTSGGNFAEALSPRRRGPLRGKAKFLPDEVHPSGRGRGAHRRIRQLLGRELRSEQASCRPEAGSPGANQNDAVPKHIFPFTHRMVDCR